MKTLIEITKAIDAAQALRRAIHMYSEKNPEITLKAIEEHIKTIPDINVQDTNKASLKTALHIAVIFEVPEVLRLLLAANARYDIGDAEGKTALCYAALSDNEALKQEMFLALADIATATIAKEFQYVSDDERCKKENKSILFQKRKVIDNYLQEVEELVSFGIPALFTSDKNLSKKPTGAAQNAHDLCKKQYSLSAGYLIRLAATQDAIAITSTNLNYCGLMGWRLCAELYKQKAIHSGKLNIKIVTVEDAALGEHEILLINCKVDANDRVSVTESTILCNPFALDSANRIVVGKLKVLAYLSGVHMVVLDCDVISTTFLPVKLNKAAIAISFDNLMPEFNHLLYANKEFSEFMSSFSATVLSDIQTHTSKRTLKHYLKEKFCTEYLEKQRKGTITKMSKMGSHLAFAQKLTNFYEKIQKEKAAKAITYGFKNTTAAGTTATAIAVDASATAASPAENVAIASTAVSAAAAATYSKSNG